MRMGLFNKSNPRIKKKAFILSHFLIFIVKHQRGVVLNSVSVILSRINPPLSCSSFSSFSNNSYPLEHGAQLLSMN